MYKAYNFEFSAYNDFCLRSIYFRPAADHGLGLGLKNVPDTAY